MITKELIAQIFGAIGIIVFLLCLIGISRFPPGYPTLVQ